MKLLCLVFVPTLITHQEAALLAAHTKYAHNVESLAGRKYSQESEINMTFEEALRALPPVPSGLKTFLVTRLGQNISSLIRIGDNHTYETRSLRGSLKQVSLMDFKTDPHNIHALEGSAGAAEMLRKLLAETLEKLDAEQTRCRAFKVRQKREIAQVSLAVSQFTANANKAHGEVLLANGRLSNTGAELPKEREGMQRHISMCEKSQRLLKTELHTHMREQSQMEFIVSLAECNESTTLLQCPSKRRGKHRASLFSFGTAATKHAVAQLKLADTRQAVQEVLKDAYGTAIDLKVDAAGTPNITSSACWTTLRCPYGWRSTENAKVCRSVNGSGECDLGYCGGEPTLNMMSCNTGPHIGDIYAASKCWNSWPCPFMMVRTGDGSVCDPGADRGQPCGLGGCAAEDDPNNGTLQPCPSVISGTTTLPPDFKEKCTLRHNPDCPNLNDKLMTMLSDVTDRVSQLQREVFRMEMDCQQIEDKKRETIGNLVKVETDATADLALATKTLNENNEASSQKQVEFDRLKLEMLHMNTTCTMNFKSLDTEECSIKKIREELYNLVSMRGEVRDCQMSTWEVERPCSATCGSATMVQRRTIQMAPSPLTGAPCRPKVEEVDCEVPIGCPVPCKLGSWSGWTECSAGCGGGVEQRSRVIEQHPYNDGAACEATIESRTCNLQACNVPCVLTPWTSWSKCSKHCGKGHRTRVRSIKHAEVGEGHCPSANDPERLWKLACNTQACTPDKFKPYLRCTSKVDLVLMLDGSGSMGSKGFAHVKHAAQKLIDTLEMGEESVVLSVMLFSGPRTWETMDKCRDGKITDLNTCGMKWVTGDSSSPKWTIDKWDAIQRVEALRWPKGGTLTGMALAEAENELAESRNDAASTVLVITDGIPSYYSKAVEAARSLRDTARLMFVPVGPNVKFDDFTDMASHPLEENIIPNSHLDGLYLPGFQNMVVENLCPELQ